VKTSEGHAELGTRRLRLSQRHRTVLLLVDGKRSETEVRCLAAQAGVPQTCFDELLGLSRIAWPEVPVAGSLTLLRLRRARSRGDLGQLLGEVEARVGKRRSLAAAQSLMSARQLLGHGADADRNAA
jgi:hypothetical protein